jgi:hypothetical protein
MTDVDLDVFGIVDMPMEDYLNLPHLSASGIKNLVPAMKGCPALFKHWAENPSPPTAWGDLGSAAHTLVLGDGAPVVEVKATDRKSPKTRQLEEEIRAAGGIPLLSHKMRIVEQMAEKLREHEEACKLLNPASGKPEQTLLWEKDGVRRRARLDWLPDAPDDDGLLIITDYKTAISVCPEDLDRSAWNFGYPLKADWYMDGVESLGLATNVAFAFIFQMSSPPYLVETRQYSQYALGVARRINDEGAALYRRCVESGQWPGFTSGIGDRLMDIPGWADVGLW